MPGRLVGMPVAFSVGGGLGSGMQAVLRHFVDAARRRLDALAVEMVERNASLADGVTLFDGFGDVRFRERRGFEQRAAGGELCGERGRKRSEEHTSELQSRS